MTTEQGENNGLQLARWITDKAIGGVPPLSRAEDLASEYLIDAGYENNDERVDSLINWETTKNFTAGFITGLGGIITLPVAVPAALGASWIIQARMAGAIAHIYGHDLKEDRVQTLVILALLGDVFKEAVKDSGIRLGRKLTESMIAQVPGKTLIEINKRVGFRLITKAGEKGILNLTKMLPVAGGLVGGCFDALACRTVGRVAKSLFRAK